MKRIAFLFLNIYTKKPLQKPQKQTHTTKMLQNHFQLYYKPLHKKGFPLVNFTIMYLPEFNPI